MGLNDSFTQICGHILLMDSLPPINQFFPLIPQKEKQREIGTHQPHLNPVIAFNAKGPNPKSNAGKRDRPLCLHCNMLDHVKDKCFKLHGFPSDYKNSSSN